MKQSLTTRLISPIVRYSLIRATCVLLTCLILVLLAVSTASGQFRQISIEELTEASTSVLVGTATKTQSFWNEKKTRIFTEVTIEVQEEVAGKSGTRTMVTIPGGRVGNTLYEVSDMPVFVEGEEVLVFVWRHPSGQNLVTGGMSGKFSVIQSGLLGARYVRGVTPAFKVELTGPDDRSTAGVREILLNDLIKEVQDIKSQ